MRMWEQIPVNMPHNANIQCIFNGKFTPYTKTLTTLHHFAQYLQEAYFKNTAGRTILLIPWVEPKCLEKLQEVRNFILAMLLRI